MISHLRLYSSFFLLTKEPPRSQFSIHPYTGKWSCITTFDISSGDTLRPAVSQCWMMPKIAFIISTAWYSATSGVSVVLLPCISFFQL